MKKISFNYRSKRIVIEVNNLGFFGKIFGLMFKKRATAKALLFDFRKPVDMRIHSLFVFFPFVAVWLDKKGKVLEIKKVMPFTISVGAKKTFYKLVEIPFNRKYDGKIKLLYP